MDNTNYDPGSDPEILYEPITRDGFYNSFAIFPSCCCGGLLVLPIVVVTLIVYISM